MRATGEAGPGGRIGLTKLDAAVLAAVAKSEVAVTSMGSQHSVIITVRFWLELASAFFVSMVVVHGSYTGTWC